MVGQSYFFIGNSRKFELPNGHYCPPKRRRTGLSCERGRHRRVPPLRTHCIASCCRALHLPFLHSWLLLFPTASSSCRVTSRASLFRPSSTPPIPACSMGAGSMGPFTAPAAPRFWPTVRKSIAARAAAKPARPSSPLAVSYRPRTSSTLWVQSGKAATGVNPNYWPTATAIACAWSRSIN